MNRAKIAELAEYMASRPRHTSFDMADYLHPVYPINTVPREDNTCGTAGCIAGFALMQEYGWKECMKVMAREATSVHMKAQELLGLTSEEADALFTPGPVDLYKVGLDDAVHVLREVGKGRDIEEAWTDLPHVLNGEEPD